VIKTSSNETSLSRDKLIYPMGHGEFEFPSVIKRAVSGLDNELRWKIIESIVNKGDMSYSRLMSELKLDNKGLLNFHLKNLSKSALIERYEDLSNTSGDRSFYTISDIGKEIINGLLAGLNPQKKILYFDPDLLAKSAIGQEKKNYALIYFGESETSKTLEIEQPIQKMEQPIQKMEQSLQISPSAT
jgi:DNA-binding MarR family transcriptional regulator